MGSGETGDVSRSSSDVPSVFVSAMARSVDIAWEKIKQNQLVSI